ncbi:MAG: peptidoglycan-associated lipoprotein Pal [Hydrotalea sp.]|nr:peptidoglycan-associated lipoprotein Pal [Hydrotalea sp.]
MKKRYLFLHIARLVLLVAGLPLLTSCAKRQVLNASGDKAQTGQVLSVLKANPAGGVQASDAAQQANDNGSANTRVAADIGSDNDNENIPGAPDQSKGYFAYDSSTLDDEAQAVVQQFGQWLIDNTDAKLTIEGHADERGTREYNLALGARRANAAKRLIVAMGVAPNRIKTISYGKERPDDPRSNEQAWSKNRRFVALKLQ